jgi:hypothetical protein
MVLLWIACGLAPAQVKPSGAASACAGCHSAQSATEPRTPMGRALELPGSNPTLQTHPKLTFHKGAYSYAVETRGDQSTYSVTDGKQTISLPIRWNFGEGSQTWVLERDGHAYESLVSYYPAIDGLDITTGDEALSPHTLDEAVGRLLGQGETKDCFGCHSTSSEVNDKLSLATLEPGVGCEHCHEGSSAHLVDAFQGHFESAPLKLKELSSEDISNFCGQCHRTWERVVRGGLRGEGNVRFQPYRLANSRCYDGTDPRISCLACHDPHQNVVRQESFYDSKCLACHGSSTQPPPAGAPAEAKSCRVASSNCVDCHMPRVKLPNGHMTFFDHEIRVVKPGEPYPD